MRTGNVTHVAFRNHLRRDVRHALSDGVGNASATNLLMVFRVRNLLAHGFGAPNHFVAALVDRHAIELGHRNRHAIRFLAITGLADVVIADALLRPVAGFADRLECRAGANVRRRTRIAARSRRTTSRRRRTAAWCLPKRDRRLD
jgi:hypothetical protein